MIPGPVPPKLQGLLRRAARAERIAQMYKQRHRILLGASLLACVVASLVAWLWNDSGSNPARAEGSRLVSPELESVLKQLRSRISQRSVARIVPWTLTAERCGHELPVVLADRANPLFRPAVLLAGHFAISSLAPRLRAAMPTTDAETNDLLVRTIERLQPWSESDLSGLLRSDAPGVAAAALSVRASRPELALAETVPSLCASEAEVRAAALAALPPSLSGEFVDTLVTHLQWAPTDHSGEALEALVRCSRSPAIERLLYERLAEHGALSDRLLSAMSRNGRRLERADGVLAIAVDPSRTVASRARALYCLERTGTKVDEATLKSIWPEHPVLDYFAARQLLLAGRPGGVQLLVRILDTSAEDEPGQKIVAEARVGARQLLAHLTDTSPYGDPSVWREWANSDPVPTMTSLPESRVNLDRELAKH